jgi:hypothetical protein
VNPEQKYRQLMQASIAGFYSAQRQLKAETEAKARQIVDAFNMASARAAAEAGYRGEKARADVQIGGGEVAKLGFVQPAWARQGS